VAQTAPTVRRSGAKSPSSDAEARKDSQCGDIAFEQVLPGTAADAEGVALAARQQLRGQAMQGKQLVRPKQDTGLRLLDPGFGRGTDRQCTGGGLPKTSTAEPSLQAAW